MALPRLSLVWLALAAATLLPVALWAQAASPTDNPTARYGYAWTDEIKWANVVSIEAIDADTVDAQLEAAQQALVARGGGVVYFPAGTYIFRESIKLKSGVVLRGAQPDGPDARDGQYATRTQFVFPRYQFVPGGNGMPNSTAFKDIELEDPVSGNHSGVVNIGIDNARIALGTGQNFAKNVTDGNGAKALIVFGCVLKNAATLDTAVPAPFQHGWQRWTQRHGAAIHVYSGGNVLVANNRIPASGEANFVMKGYVLYKATPEGTGLKGLTEKDLRTYDVTFDYDNRPGIYVNAVGAGSGLKLWDGYLGGQPQAEPGPQCLVKGLVVRNNYIFNTGCCAINVTGDGQVIAHNVIRFKPNVPLPTARGFQFDSFTNNNRAIELRGYRWVVEGNDYEVYSNLVVKEGMEIPTPGGSHYGDGEGIMHEAFNNCAIKDSKLLFNRGNRYLCLWRCPIDGLEVRGNYVPLIDLASRTNQNNVQKPLPVKNVQIVDNCTFGIEERYHFHSAYWEGIIVTGGPGENIVVKGNKQVEPGGKLIIEMEPGAVTLDANTGYGFEDRSKQ